MKINNCTPHIPVTSIKYIEDCLFTSSYGEGKYCKLVEEKLKELSKCEYCILTTSGTIALTLAIMALEIRDKYIGFPNYTMVATPHAIMLSGNHPLPMDISYETLCLDIDSIPANISGVIPVHFNSNLVSLDKLINKNIFVIEDAAACIGMNGLLKIPSSFACISFSVPKIITSAQGGAILTNNEYLAKEIIKLKDHGREIRGSTSFGIYGYNFKFNDILASLLIDQLNNYTELLEHRKEVFNRYSQNGIKLETSSLYWLPLVKDSSALEISKKLCSQGIEALCLYPPNHRILKICDDRKFPNTIKAYETVLALPHGKITNQQIDYISDLFFRTKKDLS